MKLRPYQEKLKNEIRSAWDSGARNVLAVLPTGGGKTVVFSSVIGDEPGAVCAIAHRGELVAQISGALARCGVKHNIIAPRPVVSGIIAQHVAEFGASYYSQNGAVAVASVDTLARRANALGSWRNSVSLWVQDEAHHVLASNKWGKAAELFPNARGLGVTATPVRADGKGLGAHHDGLMHALVEGPGMRDLINAGFLTDYRVFAPPSDLQLADVDVSKATGDYNATKLRAAVKKSHITGDVVQHYLKIARGKLGITFATDVSTATEIAEQFRASGVPAEVISAKTNDAVRRALLKKFARREILQLVNVDLFGEGFDLPALEVVSMARPTQSFSLYAQQFGRALRILEGKSEAIIIDHVGNVVRHGLPDKPRDWTLDRRERRGGGGPSDVIPVKACPECTGVFERLKKACPFCGHVPEPALRSGPEHVDGDLEELDASTLARMRGEVDHFDRSPEKYREELAARNVPIIGQLANVKRFAAAQEAQRDLRNTIALWAGYRRAVGAPDSESYRLFYFKYGVDVMSAQTLGVKDATNLNQKIKKDLPVI